MVPILTGVIDRFEETMAVIKLENGRELLWPRDKLGNNVSAGQTVKLLLLVEQAATAEREAIARALLNDILQKNK